MKNVFTVIISIIITLTSAACNGTVDHSLSQGGDSGMQSISITVGSSVFSVKLYDNETTSALIAQFPLTLVMTELNANEKYAYLPGKLPTASEQVGTISTGDLMLYGSDCLVLFYKRFSTSYSYTRLGYIEDVSGPSINS